MDAGHSSEVIPFTPAVKSSWHRGYPSSFHTYSTLLSFVSGIIFCHNTFSATGHTNSPDNSPITHLLASKNCKLDMATSNLAIT
jgi:hypothetical protein